MTARGISLNITSIPPLPSIYRPDILKFISLGKREIEELPKLDEDDEVTVDARDILKDFL